jgi:mercuric ion binding protein
MKWPLLLLLSFPVFAETVVVGVKGMVCSMCAQGIKKKFGALSAVTKVDVDLDRKFVTLQTAGQVEDATIRARIEEAGYAVTRIERP